MSDEFDAFPSLEAALSDRYRGHDRRDWQEWHEHHCFTSVEAIPNDATKAMIGRDRDVARLSGKTGLRHLIITNVDQPMLDAVAALPNIERLELEWPTMASDLTPLVRLPKLTFLSIDSPRNIIDFAPLVAIPALRTLMITNAKHLADLEWLRGAGHLRVIGIEGAIDKPQTIASLKPLTGLAGLEAFLGTSLRLVDQDLSPLATCPRLKFLGVAQLAKKSAFNALRAERPDVSCSWFADRMWEKFALRAA